MLLSFFTDSARRLAIPDSELSQLSLFRKYRSGARIYSECDLNSKSNVLVIGGYLGSSSEIIVNQFDSKLTIFEPIQEFAKVLEDKFSDSKKLELFPKLLLNKMEPWSCLRIWTHPAYTPKGTQLLLNVFHFQSILWNLLPKSIYWR